MINVPAAADWARDEFGADAAILTEHHAYAPQLGGYERRVFVVVRVGTQSWCIIGEGSSPAEAMDDAQRRRAKLIGSYTTTGGGQG